MAEGGSAALVGSYSATFGGARTACANYLMDDSRNRARFYFAPDASMTAFNPSMVIFEALDQTGGTTPIQLTRQWNADHFELVASAWDDSAGAYNVTAGVSITARTAWSLTGRRPAARAPTTAAWLGGSTARLKPG